MKTSMLFCMLLSLTACSSSPVSTWVPANGSPLQADVLEVALHDCAFNDRAQRVRSYRDAAQQALEFDNLQLRSVFMADAERVAAEALACMYDHGFVTSNAATNVS